MSKASKDSTYQYTHKREERERSERIFEVVAEHFPNFMEDINLHIQETQ